MSRTFIIMSFIGKDRTMDRTKYMSVEETKQLRTVAEAHAILDLRHGRIKGITVWMLVDLALSTGLRVSELANIKIEHIDFRRVAITITRSKKKKRTPETLAIGKDLCSHLQQYIDWSERTRGHLFVGQRGPLSRAGLQQIWKSAIRRAGLPCELSIHSARHTIAVHLLKKTNNLRMVQKQLGHSSPATTANMYADVSFDDMQNGVDGLYV